MAHGFIPSATAAARTIGLKVEPAWRSAVVARLNSLPGVSGVTPAIARIAPVVGSIETIAPAGSRRA